MLISIELIINALMSFRHLKTRYTSVSYAKVLSAIIRVCVNIFNVCQSGSVIEMQIAYAFEICFSQISVHLITCKI